MKKIVAVVILVALMIFLVGCESELESESNQAKELADYNSMFVTVGYYKDLGVIMYDKTTKVMYWAGYSSKSYGILTLLVNSDGTPRLWEE